MNEWLTTICLPTRCLLSVISTGRTDNNQRRLIYSVSCWVLVPFVQSIIWKFEYSKSTGVGGGGVAAPAVAFIWIQFGSNFSFFFFFHWLFFIESLPPRVINLLLCGMRASELIVIWLISCHGSGCHHFTISLFYICIYGGGKYQNEKRKKKV